MYQFRTLKSIYSVEVIYLFTDYVMQQYACKIIVNAKREKEKYLFILEERSEVELNKEKPQKVMDNLMALLGNCLYPMELHVSAGGVILSVSNFEQIKEVWTKTSEELLKQNKTREFENYLEAASKNLCDEQHFLKALAKDSFIQLYFKDYSDGSTELDFVNFPYQNRKTSYYVRKLPETYYSYSLIPSFREAGVQENEGKLRCEENNDSGELLNVEATLRLMTCKSELYQKIIRITADINEHKVKTNLFF